MAEKKKRKRKSGRRDGGELVHSSSAGVSLTVVGGEKPGQDEEGERNKIFGPLGSSTRTPVVRPADAE